MNDISYQLPEMIERAKHAAKMAAAYAVAALALVAIGHVI